MIPKTLLITPDAAELPFTASVRKRLPDSVNILITSENELPAGRSFSSAGTAGLTRFKGMLIHEVNEKERSIGDRREVYLACGINCPADCAYCFLQECASSPYPVFYADLDAMARELEQGLQQTPDLYIHLGHILDPLAFDFMAPLVKRFVEIAGRFPHAQLEIRTKFTNVDMLPPDPPSNTTVAFSFSPDRIVRLYEKRTSSLEGRMGAAARAAKAGYRIGIRLDPIIIYPGWRADYDALCRRLIATLRHTSVRDVVIGAFRGPPELIRTVRRNDPGDFLRSAELVEAAPGKLSYPPFMRIQALRFIASQLGGRFPLRFCFENEAIRDAVFNRTAG